MIVHGFQFTRHAVYRFMERVRPAASLREALTELQHLASLAMPMTRRTRYGQKLWRVDDPHMYLITKPDDDAIVVVTIIDGIDGNEEEAIEEVAEAYRRLRSVPDAGHEEPTSPAPEDARDFRSWCHVEEKRLDVEIKRLKTVNRAIGLEEKKASAEIDAARAHICRAHALELENAKTERHRMTMTIQENGRIAWRNALLRRAATELRRLDPDGCVEILGEIERIVGEDPH
jgi:hypothetical protein